MQLNVRHGSAADYAEILRLNQGEIPHVSEIGLPELEALARQACALRVVDRDGSLAGFVLALDESAEYSSLNFQWFKARYPRFTYVDRIVVDEKFQGQGIGRALYDDVAGLAKIRGTILGCEVNLKPPNPESMGFHLHLGFRQVGVQDTEGGKKTVAMMVLDARL